jgi:hypothetical protein
MDCWWWTHPALTTFLHEEEELQAIKTNANGNLYLMRNVSFVSGKQSNTLRSICWALYKAACDIL